MLLADGGADVDADVLAVGRRGGAAMHGAAHLADAGSSTFQITPGKAIMLWLALVGVFLMLLPRLIRQKRARSGQRSD